MMNGLALSIGCAVLLAGQPLETKPRPTLSRLGADFVCPEALPNDNERERASREFRIAYEQAYPASAAAGALVYRHILLKTHDCKEESHAQVKLETGFRFDRGQH
jgi:hypothetical protein